MAAPRCSPPKSQGVKWHTRSKPRGRPRRKTPATYWECHRGGQSCGTHHGSYSAALRHSMRLDRTARKQGQRAGWDPRKHGG